MSTIKYSVSILIVMLFHLCSATILCSQNSVSATYSSGDIPTSYNMFDPECNGPSHVLSVTLPDGDSYEVTGIDITYQMTATNSGFMSDQRSHIYCQNTSTLEPNTASGTGNTEGTFTYTRAGLSIANGEFGGNSILNFEMRTWRVFGSAPACGNQFNKVDDGTWTIVVYFGEEIIKPKVGINTSIPEQTLQVEGKLQVGDDLIPPTEGTIRYTDGNFEGWDGDSWGSFNSFKQNSQGTILFSELGSDQNLIDLGYELAGSSELYNTKSYQGEHLGTFTEISVPANVNFRYGHTAVWTGTEMLIWGGTQSHLNDPIPSVIGFREVISYNPSTNVWTVIPLGAGAPPHTRSGHSAIWTGTHMIIWGGRSKQGLNTTTYSDGYAYDPATNSWNVLTQSGNIPTARFNHDAIWTGSDMIVYGGGSALGGRYDLNSGNWSTLPIGPSAMNSVACIRVGLTMIVYGRGGNTQSGIFNFQTNSWTFPLPTNGPHPASGQGMDAIWTGNEMIVWGGNLPGGRYSTTTNNFEYIANKGPIITRDGSAIWTGTEMIIFGGQYNPFPWIQNTLTNQCHRFTLTGEDSSYTVGGTKTIFYYRKSN